MCNVTITYLKSILRIKIFLQKKSNIFTAGSCVAGTRLLQSLYIYCRMYNRKSKKPEIANTTLRIAKLLYYFHATYALQFSRFKCRFVICMDGLDLIHTRIPHLPHINTVNNECIAH